MVYFQRAQTLQANADFIRSKIGLSFSGRIGRDALEVGDAGMKAPLAGPASGIRAAFSIGKERVLWSGGKLAKDSAAELAKRMGGTTLEQTPIGKLADRFGETIYKTLGETFSRKVWDALSKTFAKTAKQSEVKVVINPANYRGADSTLQRIEIPNWGVSNPTPNIIRTP